MNTTESSYTTVRNHADSLRVVDHGLRSILRAFEIDRPMLAQRRALQLRTIVRERFERLSCAHPLGTGHQIGCNCENCQPKTP